MNDRSSFSRYRTPLFIGLALVIGILLGRWLFSGPSQPAGDQHEHVADGTIWTCSMDPQVRMTEPGECPICGMDLIPLRQLEGDHDAMEVHLSPAAQRLAGVRTAVVGQGSGGRQVRLTGRVEPDERLVSIQSAHVPGRIEELMVSFTGQSVRKGQELARIYSPELAAAQEELFQALAIREEQPGLYNAVRQRLRNWRMSDQQIDALIASGQPQETYALLADVSGIVLERQGALGDYVSRGDVLYRVGDLSRIWVLFDVYEADLAWVKQGAEVEFTVRSLPGETFTGKISFVDPVIDPATRVARARVEVPNAKGQLKPDMFVTGRVRGEARIVASEIVIPRSAILWTGERSVVYVAGEGGHGFQLREVTLGPNLGDSTVISSGLEAGERVVVNGAFSIDAAAQLEGKVSMMNPEADPRAAGGGAHDHGAQAMEMGATGMKPSAEAAGADLRDQVPEAFKAQLNEVVDAYLRMKDALVRSDLGQSAEASTALLAALNKVNEAVLKGEAKAFWDEKKDYLFEHTRLSKEAGTLEGKRENFVFLSQPLIKIVEAFGAQQKLYVDYCPMVNDGEGAYWLSAVEQISNPYLPETMLRCGRVEDVIVP